MAMFLVSLMLSLPHMLCDIAVCHSLTSKFILCHTLPYPTILDHTLPYPTILYHTLPYSTIPYHTLPYPTILYHTLPHSTIPCNNSYVPHYSPQISPELRDLLIRLMEKDPDKRITIPQIRVRGRALWV